LHGKTGFGMARLKRLLRLEDYAFNRTLADMTIDLCPLADWQGMTFQQVFERVLAAGDGNARTSSDDERRILAEHFSAVKDEADFMLAMLRAFDLDLSWYTVSANRNEALVRELLMDPLLLPGFNDSGAHLTNMAFYDGNLRGLKLAAQGGEEDVAYLVKRLTRDAAEVFRVKGGTVEVGDQADLILIDPQALQQLDHHNTVQRIYRDEFSHDQLVNRTDGVVPLVMIKGHPAWRSDRFDERFGRQKFGEVLETVF
jgi:hypothetical protein